MAHWVGIAAAVGWLWGATQKAFSKISDSLPAPTAQSSEKYKWWFVFVNRMAGNNARAENLAHIEDSPNFVAAADAYMKKKLAESNKPN